MAGGEILFGTRGFAPLCHIKTVDVIMPDVKHCGGLHALTRIAAVAEAEGVDVAHLTQADLDLVAARLNARPRETLGFQTPAHCFEALLR